MSALSALNGDAVARALSDADVIHVAQALLELEKDEARRKWQNFFPDEGPLRRELYPRHVEFFRAGATHRERLFMAANRVGKTITGAVEVSFHLTGRYPEWWEGRRFEHPIDAWVAGDTNETTRDIIQKTLLGNIAYDGALKCFDGIGVVPFDCHGKPKFKPNAGDLLDYIEIRHEAGGNSRLAFKSYDQGRRVFQGTAKHLIWLDEECPMDVYGECLIRTTTTNGIILLTFTPLLGMSEVVRGFLQPEEAELTDA